MKESPEPFDVRGSFFFVRIGKIPMLLLQIIFQRYRRRTVCFVRLTVAN